ncbi:predicted protein [Histoplasma capsulatum H143]|uniref:Uncharacterized protein n=1 Tax=Ajellomyces capsulatus (strain H143) TaxID=544712 RepID=C6HGF7_AJECH|nr:predicted protein [Histoplasma capsulatum H143]
MSTCSQVTGWLDELRYNLLSGMAIRSSGATENSMQATFIRDLFVSRTTGKHAISMLGVWVSKRKTRAGSSQVSGSVPSGRTIAVLYKANLCGEGLVLIPEYPSVTRGRASFLLVETTTGNLRHGKWGRPLLTPCRTRTNAFASAERSLRVLLDVEGYTYQKPIFPPNPNFALSQLLSLFRLTRHHGKPRR